MPTDKPDILDYKSIRDPKKLDEIPIDTLKKLYLEAITDLDEFKKEHNIMKQFIYTNGLWNRFLNYDAFIDHLRNDNIAKEVIKKC